MRYKFLGAFLWLAVSAFAIAAGVATASAEIVVLESNAKGYDKNARFPDDEIFILQKGAKVRLLLKPSEKTRTMRGPFSGTVDQYQAKYSGWLGRLRHTWDSMVDEKPGVGELGTRKPMPEGGVRGLPPSIGASPEKKEN